MIAPDLGAIDKKIDDLIAKLFGACNGTRTASSEEVTMLQQELTKEDHHYVTMAQRRIAELLRSLREQQAIEEAAVASQTETAKQRSDRMRQARSDRLAAQLHARVERKRTDQRTWELTLRPSAAGSLASQGPWISANIRSSNVEVYSFRETMEFHGSIVRQELAGLAFQRDQAEQPAEGPVAFDFQAICKSWTRPHRLS